MVNIVKLHRSVRSPSPHQRLRQSCGISGIPVSSLCSNSNSQFSKLVFCILSQRLTYRIRSRINNLHFSTYAVFFADSVFSFFPAGILKNFYRSLKIVLCFCLLVIPGHFVTYAVCGSSVAVQYIVDHFFTVDSNVDRASYFHITGKVISCHYSVFFFCRSCRKIKSTVINCIYTEQLISVDFRIRIGSCSMRYVYRSGLSCRKSCILFHKKNRNLFHLWFFSVIIRIGLKDHLLPLIPLLHDITS